MTISEAQSILHCPDAYGGIYGEKYGQAMAVAFEALKQADILDKIRAEIEQKCCITVGQENEPAITLYDVFQIIDKYKVESEDEG